MPLPQEESRLRSPNDPVRTCVGCRRRAAVSELDRLALDASGEVVVSATAPGRGAWLCRRSSTCADRAVSGRRLDRAFRRPVAPRALAAWREAFAPTQTNVRESKRSGDVASTTASPVKG